MKKNISAQYSPSKSGGNSPRSNDRGDSIGALDGKNSGIVLLSEHRTVPVQNPHDSVRLPPLTTPQLIREVQEIVLSFPIKEMAEMQGATTRAVEAQRNGDSAMSARALINLGRSNGRARAMIARLIGVPGACSDPDFMEGLEKVVNYYMRQQSPDPAAAVDHECHVADLFGGKP